MRPTLFTTIIVGIWLSAAPARFAAADEPVRFDGHRVVRATAQTADELALIRSLTDDFWSHHVGVGRPLDFRVTPEQFEQLQASGLPFTILIPDIQARIDLNRQMGGIAAGEFDDYMDLAGVMAYVDTLIALRPDLATKFVVGTSLQSREIVGVKITGPAPGPKPAMMYIGCQHAREWVTVPAMLYIIDQLVRNYDLDPAIRELVDSAEWHIVPIVNPDGYAYTWTNNRLWRKNRRANGNGTFGVDLNRNWSVGWGDDAGSSGFPGDETYRGTAPFSEPETTAVANYILANPQILGFNDVHSYSQLILLPYAYQGTTPPNIDEYYDLGFTMQAIVQGVHGKYYETGPTAQILYVASGDSGDWAHDVAGTLALGMELRDTGLYGFELPPDQIIPQCEELFPAIMFQTQFTTAPVWITFPSGIPANFLPGVPSEVFFDVANRTGTVDPASVTLGYRTAGSGQFIPIAAQHLGGTSYKAIIPPRGCGPTTKFYVTASSTDGDAAYNPLGLGSNFYSVPMGSEVTLNNDNFETDLGWTIQNGATSGAWVRVTPRGTFQNGNPAQPGTDNPAGTGTVCWVTGQGSVGGSVGEADVDGGVTRLISPRFVLGGYDPQLSYARWFYSVGGVTDTMTVEISNSDGLSWVPVETVGHTGSWVTRTIRVADYVTPTNTVRLRFSTSDNPNDSITEAAIDDVRIVAFNCSFAWTKADCNCDGVVDSFDIGAFTLAVTNQAEYAIQFPGCDIDNADVDDDGDIDAFDIAPFIAALTG